MRRLRARTRTLARSIASHNLHEKKMKSAYELAMERLQQQSPSAKLTDEQKAQIAEIDSLYRAKIAEREVFLQGEIAKETAAGRWEELEKLEHQLRGDVRRLQDECEAKKNKVRGE
jgi:hypothetical protein